MEIIRDVKMMQQTGRSFGMEDKSVGFVPTMGALHEGHLSLIRRCKEDNEITVVSIFVNPAQFGPSEDFNGYPQDPESDMMKLEDLGVDLLFFPEKGNIYPDGFSTHISVEGLSDRLCGLYREGHFRGVATVVAKLFNIVNPDRAYFGQKDYQQALIIKRLVRDLNFDLEIIVCPTVREEDGLAMSSRNLYLSEEERAASAVIYRTLIEAGEMIRSGSPMSDVGRFMELQLKGAPMIREIQYASVYDPETLEDISMTDVNIYVRKRFLLALAVFIGKTRLIDNILVES